MFGFVGVLHSWDQAEIGGQLAWVGEVFDVADHAQPVYNPQTGGPDEVTDLESAVGTKYDALWVSVRQLFGKYGEFDAAYTLAKAFNYANDDQIPFEYSPIDPNNLQREYGPPPNDQRHRLVMNGIANLPYKFQFSPVWTIASGVPMDELDDAEIRDAGRHLLFTSER